jgi:uncharacterized protein (DUF3084 family)
MPDHDEIIRAEIDAYRAESQAFRAESAAFRAEIAAYHAESHAQFQQLKGQMDRQDRDIATIINELMRINERLDANNGDEP